MLSGHLGVMTTMKSQTHAQGAAALRRIAFGMRAAQALFVAAELKVADHLAHKAMTSSELSKLTGADADALRRVMRTLCALDTFA
jgi:hypothetical protein